MKSTKSTRRTYRPKKQVSFASRVKKVIKATAQLKHSGNELFTDPVASQTFYFVSPTQRISQGTDIQSRLGDQVKLQYLKINGYVNAPSTTLTNTRWRIFVFYSSIGAAAATTTSGAFTASQLFQSGTGVANKTSGIFDEKAITVLADQLIDLNSMVDTSKDVKSFAMNIPLHDFKFSYVDGGSAFGKNKNLYLAVTGYTTNVAAAANIGSYYYSYDLGFKDI